VSITTRPDAAAPARARFAEYRRLLVFLRPHWWRMAGNVVANVIGAALGAFSYTLLVPFLNTLFHQPNPLSKAAGWVETAQRWTIGAFVDQNKTIPPADVKKQREEMKQLGLPIGWDEKDLPEDCLGWFYRAAGWL